MDIIDNTVGSVPSSNINLQTTSMIFLSSTHSWDNVFLTEDSIQNVINTETRALIDKEGIVHCLHLVTRKGF